MPELLLRLGIVPAKPRGQRERRTALGANQWPGMHRSIKDYVGWATYGWGLILRESAEHIAQNLPGQIAKMGENISVARFVRFKVGDAVAEKPAE